MTKLTKSDLSPDQLNALNLMLDWYNGPDANYDPFVLKGAAGTGKTSILPVFLNEAHIKPLNTIGLATSAIAAKNIGDKTDIVDVRTIAGFLKIPQSQLTVNYQGQQYVFMTLSQLRHAFLSHTFGNVSKTNQLLQVLDTAVDNVHKIYTKVNDVENAEAPSIQSTLLNMIDVKTLNRLFKHVSMFSLETSFVSKPQDMSQAAKDQFDTVHLLIIDELSMIPASDISAILNLAIELHIPVLMVGDPFQLEPVKSSATPYMTNDNYQYQITLLKLHRQSNYIAVLGSLLRPPANLDFIDAYSKLCLDYNGPFDEINVLNNDAIFSAKLNGSLIQMFNNSDMVLAQTNLEVRNLTDEMRADKYNLSMKVAQNDSIRLGDKIRISMNEITGSSSDAAAKVNMMERFMNGMLGEVIYVHPDDEVYGLIEDIDVFSAKIYKTLGLKCVDIRFEDGRIRHNLFINTLDIHDPKLTSSTLYGGKLFKISNIDNKAPAFYRHFQDVILDNINSPFYDIKYHHASVVYVTFGYVLTIYKAQGREWDNVTFSLGQAYGSLSTRQKMIYTAITRAKTHLNVLVLS